MADEVKWFVGIDWASEQHQVGLFDADGHIVGERVFVHGGEGLAGLCARLVVATGGPPEAIAVAIEVPHGPVVETMLERGFPAYAINPKQLDRFRDRFSMSGAKDDRRDGRVLADSLRTDGQAFRRLSMDDPVVVELREWSRMAEDLKRERCRLTNRVREQLWRYYPQMLVLQSDLGADWLASRADTGQGEAGVSGAHRRHLEGSPHSPFGCARGVGNADHPAANGGAWCGCGGDRPY